MISRLGGIGVGAGVGVGVGRAVGDAVGRGVGRGVGRAVGCGVGVGVGRTVAVGVGLGVAAGDGVGVGVTAGLGVEMLGVGIGDTTALPSVDGDGKGLVVGARHAAPSATVNPNAMPRASCPARGSAGDDHRRVGVGRDML
ncbi:MAG: hypothetical protein ACXW4T_09105 [Candidatus Limnocylindrales bacterium]